MADRAWEMEPDVEKRLAAFAREHRFDGKGALSVALVVTRAAMRLGLPLDASGLKTSSHGQVSGLSKSAVANILKDHQIDRVLAEEGGRTSRGSIAKMEQYVLLLNDLGATAELDLAAVEAWWVDRVRAYFAGKPLSLRLDPSKSLAAAVRDLLAQAEKRQKESNGTMYAGAVLQHLVGAKLELVVGDIQHHGASVADQSTGREADFMVGDVALHVTVAPGEALLRKCERNLENGMHPLLLTTARGATVARALAEQAGIADRVDVLDAEQFLTANLYEHGKFSLPGRRETAQHLVEVYNRVVTECETDPSLRVDIG